MRFANDLEDYGKVENMPVLEGKRMIIMVAPIKRKLQPPLLPKRNRQQISLEKIPVVIKTRIKDRANGL